MLDFPFSHRINSDVALIKTTDVETTDVALIKTTDVETKARVIQDN